MTGGPLVVVGDALLDRDIDGSVTRVSPDAPVPVLDSEHALSRPGGAALAARMSASDGRTTVLVTAIAGDAAGRELAALLQADGVRVVNLGLGGATPEKIRLRSGGHSLLRLDRGGSPAPVGAWSPAATEAVAGAGAILVSDYGRGMAILPAMRAALSEARAPVVWDPHPRGAPPVPGVRVVTPNRAELAAADGAAAEPSGAGPLAAVTAAARRARTRWACGSVVVTMGSVGSVLVTGDAPPLVVPAVPIHQGDPCGAGDRFAVSLAAALGGGEILADAVVAATQAASAHVAGASSPQPADGRGVDGLGATSRAEVVDLVGRARARGMTVAVAGGCFDVLHAGHIALLAAASSLADVLVVVVNSDRSVRRLKGAGRPVVPEADRLAVLASLGAVHAVTVFDEATPMAVLEELQPDVFVKGGDYAHGPLAEEALLARWGGQAVVVPYLDGRSTTGLLRATGLLPAATPAP